MRKKNLMAAILGGIWPVAWVDDRPHVVLRSWKVFELNRPGVARARYFAGYNETDGEGRASAHIVRFDPARGRGITNSGRVYELRGTPGFNLDGEYVWNRWKKINAAAGVVDVTDDVQQQMAEASSKRA